ncbi:MAG: diguanylate cyclase [Candidatus Dormiibacterota bacterium]
MGASSEQWADRLQATVRESDAVGRIRGNEFAILVGGRINAAHATALAAKNCGVFKSPLANCEGAIVGLSVGVAMYPRHDGDPEQLLRCAEAAMYAAKGQPDCWRLYDASMRSRARAFEVSGGREYSGCDPDEARNPRGHAERDTCRTTDLRKV